MPSPQPRSPPISPPYSSGGSMYKGDRYSLLYDQDDPMSHQDVKFEPNRAPTNFAGQDPLSQRSWFSRNGRIMLLAAGQTAILFLGWGFLAATVYQTHIALPDSAAHYVYSSASETTFVASLIASAIALVSIWIYSLAIQLALTNRVIRQPIPLQIFGFSVKISRGSLVIDRRHLGWTWGSAMVWLAVGTSASGWTALLNPKTILLPGYIDGTEIDLGSASFSEYTSQVAIPEDGSHGSIAATINNAFELMDIAGTLVGHSSGGTRLGLPSFFNFNGGSYNLSTGGILPAIPDFVDNVSTPTATMFAFGGGTVVLNTTVHNNLAGMSRNYTVNQQGLTANVSCSQQDLDSPSPFSLLNNYVFYNPPNSPGNNTGYRFWTSSANCSNSAAQIGYYDQGYVTTANATNYANCAGTGFLPVVACPMQDTSGPNNNSFTIVMMGECKYDFIPPTICEVTPIVTNVVADYNNGIISAQSPQNYYALGESNPTALSFIVGLAVWIGGRAQGPVGNSIGDSVFLIQSTQQQDQTTTNATINTILEDYWRGVVEFGGTFIRSGFSAEGTFENNVIPPNMTRSLQGVSYVLTMGWSYQSVGTLVTLLPQTFIALLTFVVLAMAGGDAIALRDGFDLTDVGDVVLSTTSNSAGLQGVPAGAQKKVRTERESVQLQVTDDGRKVLMLGY